MIEFWITRLTHLGVFVPKLGTYDRSSRQREMQVGERGCLFKEAYSKQQVLCKIPSNHYAHTPFLKCNLLTPSALISA